ncbi:flagellar filament capping protein FliD [Pengzhenrongella sp.]|jgi:flagellar hook-associated protein 2|uniref:flagellar filament capping protein FliD n=1 Tax=Pengzhenrongella sp. TaxID=2888820 RepID=UPI002F95E7FE
MANVGIDGLSSGIDTTSLINSLMQVEAMPQTLLKANITTTNTFVSALQGLNAKVASLATSATTASLPASWAAVTATSSDSSVRVTTSGTAQAGSLSFTVDHVATAQTSVTGAVTTLAALFGGAVPATVTLGQGPVPTATAKVVSLTGVTTLAGFASAINAAGTGVTATVVKVSDTQSRLQLTSNATGTASGFDLYSGTVTAGAIQGGTAPAATIARADAITSPSDAAITLWAGTTAEQHVTSASNTFTGILTGIDLTVSTLKASPVTVTIARNDAAVKKLATDMIGSLGVVFSEITSRTATTTTTKADGTSSITGGVLSGDTATRALQQAVLTAASYPVDDVSPSTVGIVIGRDGTISFDEAKFTAAMAADPANVQKIIQAVATRVATVTKAASDPLEGSLSLKIKGQQSLTTSMNAQVSAWDVTLALRKESLQKTYSDLEVTLSNLKAQGNWLTSQLSALLPSTTNA